MTNVTKLQARLEAEVVELRGRVSALQHDLDTSEAVQRDFVRLSQSLQVQLEKIRQSEKEVMSGLLFCKQTQRHVDDYL